MDYIEKVIGEAVIRCAWQGTNKLPYFLTNEYDIEQAEIGQQGCLVLKPKGELGTISAVKKHIGRIQTEWNGPVIIEVPKLTRQRKQTLITEKIPFVVPGKQLFLPFMGTLLHENNDSEKIPVPEKLQPSAQMLLFCFIYGKNIPLYLSQIPAKFNFSAMTVSRAANQLTQTGLLEDYKDGVQRVLTSPLAPKDLYEKSKPFLLDPVRKRFYINKSELPVDFFISGESALAQKSMLSRPNVEVYGIAKVLKFASQTSQLIDNEKQCEVEVWRYDPTSLSGEGCADVLSLALSVAHLRDERVEITTNEMLEKVLG